MNPSNPHASPGAYLRTKVLTASPQELRLMLYEGAIKFARQARHALGRGDSASAYAALVRAQNVVMELRHSLNHAINPELCTRLDALYSYIYVRLVEANVGRDAGAIDEAIGLLEFQRETWSMAMRKSRDTAPPAGDLPATPDRLNPLATIGPRPAPAAFHPPAQPVSRFSVEG